MKPLFFFLALALAVPAFAQTPQTSDAALKLAQVPPLVFGSPKNFQGLTVRLSGYPDYAAFNSSNVSAVDFTGLAGLGNSLTVDGITQFTGLSDLYAVIASGSLGGGNSVSFSGCGLTNVDGFLTAFNVGEAALFLGHNTITGGAVGVALVFASPNSPTVSLDACGLTACPTITSWTPTYGGNLLLNNNAMDLASIDAMLGVVAGSGTINNLIDVSGGANASLDATGLAYVATIVGNGGTVNYNP